ncbi:hypothetical protein E7744_06670 [Citricoccus sp. SGAir0253]|uniref:hypothetical protein n=1 Tax=Citricoccus sp. SGAir0253 TaxID=2567881 RepID=UPI0010CD1C85|nr:hypothetical protein [Citricoccus sp. SGAir0253]QCU77906.1 hypothetical protein E7744_06670 [Citricoccus sp. SGAir0253]
MSTAQAEPPPFLVPGMPFTAAELRAMERSGLVVHVVGDLYAPADRYPRAPDGRPTGREAGAGADAGVRWRAAAVRRLAGPVLAGPWAAMGLTAAWVHAGGEAPGVLEASVTRYHRRPLHPGAVTLRLEQSALALGRPAPGPGAEADVVVLHGLCCTTVPRTVEDLLRTGTGPAALRAAARLVPRCDPQRLRDRFEARRRRAGMADARRALEVLLDRPGRPG